MSQDRCYCHVLRKATRRMTALYDAALADCGITLSQYSQIRTIGRSDGISLTELGRTLDLDRSTVGRNIRLLEKLGLVCPSDSADRRQAAVRLSAHGREVLARATLTWQALQSRLDDRLGADRLKALMAELDRL